MTLRVNNLVGLGSSGGSVEISFVGSTTNGINNGGDYTLDLTALTGGSDSSPSTGDVIIVAATSCVESGTGNYPDMNSSGFTQITEIEGSDTYVTSCRIWYKVVGGTPDTGVDIGGSGSGARSEVGLAFVFRGVDNATPLDVTTTTATGANTVLANPPSITPTTAGSWIMPIGAGGHGNDVDTFSSSELSNFASKGINDTGDATIGAGTIAWSGGAFDPAAFSFSGSDLTFYSWAAATLALRPG